MYNYSACVFGDELMFVFHIVLPNHSRSQNYSELHAVNAAVMGFVTYVLVTGLLLGTQNRYSVHVTCDLVPPPLPSAPPSY